MEGIVFALSQCKVVHVYGFNIDTDNDVPYHYHDQVQGVTSAHSFNYQVGLLPPPRRPAAACLGTRRPLVPTFPVELASEAVKWGL